MKLVIHVAKMQQILFFVHRLMMNVNFPIGNVYYRSVLPVLILLSQELKFIHQTEHQWLRLTHIWLNLPVHIILSAFMDTIKPSSSGELVSSLCNYCMEHSSKVFGTLCFTLDSASVISKVSQANICLTSSVIIFTEKYMA